MSSPPGPPRATLPAAAAAWAEERRVPLGRWSVRYREAGSGPPVVLVHGLGVSSDYWYRNGPWLAAAGFRVLAPDLPGFGRTAGPPRGLSISQQAEALHGLAEAWGLGPAVWVGHSLSCQSVLQLACDHPARVRALVLASPTGGPGVRQLKQLWGFLLDIPREPLKLVPMVAQAYLQAGLVRYWHTWFHGAAHEPLLIAPGVAVPSLVIAGERDPVVHRGFAQRLAAALPQGRILWVPRAAHAILFDQPAGFNEAVVDFLHALP